MARSNSLSCALLALLAIVCLAAVPVEALADFTVYVCEDGPDTVQGASMQARFFVPGQGWTDWAAADAEGPNPGEYHWEIPDGATLIQIAVPSYLEPVSPDDPVVEMDPDLLSFNWEVIDHR
ncbi:MAG: hypothetical protein FJY67_10850 [Calditrichaeota bacterium]|nr:hypothetical protein [Calditrichota bacterium]